MNRAIAYQEQDCSLTLQEGLDIYYSLLDSYEDKSIRIDRIIDNDGSTTMRDHDCTHVIFGLDISIDQEAILDTWVLWGSSFKWKYLMSYAKLPQIKNLQKRLFNEFGIKGFLSLYWNTIGIKRKVFFRTRKMKKKWPFQMPEEYLDIKICDLREEYGIKILSSEDLVYKSTKWSGSIDSP